MFKRVCAIISLKDTYTINKTLSFFMMSELTGKKGKDASKREKSQVLSILTSENTVIKAKQED